MQITETFYPPDRTAWRRWLEENHAEKKEVWLVSYRKAADRPSVAYADAVEEALCFGWIDSTRKSLDEDRLAQRFTPRRPGSGYSQTNRERLARLLDQGLVIPAVRAELGDDFRADDYELPADILAELRANERAWHHFRGYRGAYQRIRVAYVDAARDHPDEFRRRLDHLVRKTAEGKQFGHGIETFYG